MSIILYPFKTIIFKTSLTRYEVRDRISSQTYLSDANFRRQDDLKKFFFGEVSEFDFSLQNISNEKRFVQYYKGEIKGVENEVYVFLTAKGLKHRRIYVLLLLLILLALGFIISDGIGRGTQIFKDPGFLIGTGIMLLFLSFLAFQFRVFSKRISNTVLYFRGLLDADCINREEVPSIFRA